MPCGITWKHNMTKGEIYGPLGCVRRLAQRSKNLRLWYVVGVKWEEKRKENGMGAGGLEVAREEEFECDPWDWEENPSLESKGQVMGGVDSG